MRSSWLRFRCSGEAKYALSVQVSSILVMSEDSPASVTVLIAGRQPAEFELTDAQAAGDACICCSDTSPGELIPVGVIVPPVHGSGIAMPCEQCAPTLFTL